MTVLFVDVVRSMDMSELFNRCGTVIQRYGGMVDKFTGDGIMALFGAPIALEDHAIRACVAALDIQREAAELAGELLDRDGVLLAVRVGLNSGDVVVGQVGSSPSSYTAVGVQVGIAQRMESVAPPGGVLVSEATARLVEHIAVLEAPAKYAIKGSAEPVPARRLLAVTPAGAVAGRREAAFAGRDDEMVAIDRLLDGVVAGQGSAVGVNGPAGIGKSRLCRELLKSAHRRGIESFSTFCESHTREVPFRAVARLLRAFLGITEVDAVAARAVLRARFPAAEQVDLVLLDDLVGIRDPAVHSPAVSAEARRRRVSTLLEAAASASATPAVFILEDMHWIDEASESTLVDFLSVVLQTPAVVVVTYRPEYRGALSRLPGLHQLPLAPLEDSATAAIAGELMGTDPSVGALTERIIESAAGNPFYVQEIVREFSERGVIVGERGAFRRQLDVGDVSVPPTLQATIGARIDRLSVAAKRVLNAAAVIGRTVGPDLLAVVLGDDHYPPPGVLAELVHSELIDQVMFTPRVEYAFRHPLVQTVAHDAQLKPARDQMHRRLALALERRDPTAAEGNAVLIAAHLEAAGDDHAAVGWLLRAGTWFTNRDINAARASWQRARRLADRLPTDVADRSWMRAVPTAMLCASAWRAGGGLPEDEFDGLKGVCSDRNLRLPLAIGMAGLLSGLAVHARIDAACRMSAEYIALVDSIGEPTLTVGLLYPVIHAKYEAGEMADVLVLALRVVDLADGDPVKGNFLTGSPLAFATSMRGVAKCAMAQGNWKMDFDQAIAIARVDPTTYVSAVMFKYVSGIAFGALSPDAAALEETAEALRTAQRCREDFALHMAELACGVTMVAASPGNRSSGARLLSEARSAATDEHFMLTAVPVIDLYAAADMMGAGELDGAVELLRSAIAAQLRTGGRLHLGATTATLVDALVRRGGRGDLDEAEAAADALAAVATPPDFVIYTLPSLEISARLAFARGDHLGYRETVDRYLAVAAAAGFDGHITQARAMV